MTNLGVRHGDRGGIDPPGTPTEEEYGEGRRRVVLVQLVGLTYWW
jgi:hypothetical protein